MESELRFNHLGVAVSDIEKAVAVYEDLFGYKLLSGPFDDSQQQATVCFIGTDDPPNIVFELVAPLNDSSHVARLLAKGAGAYHVCYEVDDISATVAGMRAKGCLLVSGPTPAVAFEERRIAWLYTPTRQLMELVER
jgi:methylmalonyl-CoA/ethylmalonyl-CoA epimerase